MNHGLTTEFSTKAPRDDEWAGLASALSPDSQFATAAWIRAWGKSFLPYQNWRPPLRYATVRATDGRLAAVFPVADQRQSVISVASLGGYYWPFRTPILPESAGSEACTALASSFTASRKTLALRYGPVPHSQPGIAGFNAALEDLGWRVHGVKLGETFAVDLPGTWDAFERLLGRNLATNTRYYERKMRREGDFEIRHIENVVGAPWSETIRDLAIVEEKSWQNKRGGKLRFLGERNESFWKILLCGSGFEEMVSIWLMYFNGEPVSFCFCIDCADTRHIIANNYAEHVRAYSTGSILYRHVFRDAVESNRIRRVNIGMGDPGYKTRWGAAPAFSLMDWIAFRPGARGNVLDVAHGIHRIWARQQLLVREES